MRRSKLERTSLRLLALTPIAAVLAVISLPVAAADVVWTGLGGADSSWHNTDNWAGSNLPGAGDNAIIGAIYTPTFGSGSGTQTIGALLADGDFKLYGGTLNVSLDSRVLGTLYMSNGTLGGGWPINVLNLVWTGNGSDGSMTGSGITNVAGNAQLGDGINPGSQQVGATNPLGRTLIFGGNTLFQSSALKIRLGSTVTNNGTFTSKGSVQGTNTFDNQITRNGSPGDTGDSVFNNAGTYVQDAAGYKTTVSARFNNTGAVQLVSGALSLTGGGTSPGSFQIGAGTALSLAGAGIYTHELSGSMNNLGALTVTGGGVHFADGFSYSGSGSVSISGGAVLQVSGNFAPASLALSNGKLTGPQTVEAGTLDWTVSGGTSTMTGGGTTTVTSAATLGGTYQNLGGMDLDGVNRARVLNLQGTTTLQSSSWNINYGSAANNGGTLTSRGYRYVSGGKDRVADSTIASTGSGNTFANSGVFIQDPGPLIRTTVNPLFTNTGTVDVRSGTLVLQNTVNYNADTQTLDGGTWKASGNGVLGIYMGKDKSIINNAANIVLDGPSAVIGNSYNYYPAAGLAGFAHNQAAGHFELRNGANLTTAGAFDNAGTVSVGAGSTFSAGSGGSASFTQSAGATLVAGTLRASSVQIDGGVISGGGSILASLTSAGELSPGTSPGKLAVSGNFTQTDGGTLKIEIGGYDRGLSYDWLAVAGMAHLAGTLDVTFLPGFAPMLNDTFVPLSYASYDGGFGAVHWFGLGPAYRLETVYEADGLTLKVAAVPEPGTYAMFASGLALLGWAVRRRRAAATLRHRGLPSQHPHETFG